MSFKRPKFYRHMDFSGNLAVSVEGGFASSGPLHQDYEEHEVAEQKLHWGDHLRPHHFNFAEASSVLLRLEGRRDVACQAISVFGRGWFLASESSTPQEFLNGAIIVKAGDRYRLFSFDEFKSKFVLDNGAEIETLYQIDYQTPKK